MSTPSKTLIAAVLLTTSLGAAGAPGEGTRRMVERLEEITRKTDPKLNMFMNGARAKLLETSLAEEDPSNAPSILWVLAQELLNAGRTSEAIARLDELELMMRNAKADQTSKDWIDLRIRQAVGHLRRAEEENCIDHHGALSCIFPIQPSGVHKQKRGALAAAGILEQLLAQNPSHLQARWLLNVAHMVLGDYPGAVPERWLLAPAFFKSERDMKPFSDVAAAAGVDVDDLAGGVIVDDFDGDGYPDIMVSAMGLRSQLRYFRNGIDGTFKERTTEAGLTGLFGGLNLMQTDYDNDGRPDVLVLRGGWMGRGGLYPNSLLHNDGNGRFSDVTEEAGLLSFHPTQTATWMDYDGDGWLDLFIGNESAPAAPHPSELYRNNGDGTFTECSRPTGLVVADFVKGVTSGDYDNDGRPDVYVSVLGAPNRLYHNEAAPGGAAGMAGAACGGRRFTEVAAAAGVVEPRFSFPTWFWDYDNDGWEDLFVSGYLINPDDVAAEYLGIDSPAERPRLYRNNHDGTFADVTRKAGLYRTLLTMGSNYGDLDYDGWLDFYAGTGNPDLGMLLPNRAFHNDGGARFQDVTTAAGLGHLQKGHGVAFVDLDNDGDQDIYLVTGGAFEADHFRNALFENPGNGNHWVSLKLEGVKSNRPAIGARIKVVVSAAGGERTLYKTVRSGGSFGASPLKQEIGLGDAVSILRVEIQWPAGGPPQIVTGLELDRIYVVREGSARPTAISLKRLHLGGRPAKPS